MSTRDPTTPHNEEPTASAGWRAEYPYQGVDTSIEPDPDVHGSLQDRLEAAGREDRPERYREKHRDGRSS